MPFKSAKQRRFLFKNHPRIARRWANEAKRSGGKSKGRKGKKR